MLAVEALPAGKPLPPGLFLLLWIKRLVAGVRAMHVRNSALRARVLLASLSTESFAALPGQFESGHGSAWCQDPSQLVVSQS